MPYRSTAATRRNAELKRVAFLRAARSLVATQGFGGATVAVIAEQCGASVGSVYSYFDNREQLLAEVFRSAASHELTIVRTAVAEASPDATDQLSVLIRTFAGRALRGRRMAWSLLFEPVTPAVEAERLVYRRSYTELGEQVIRTGIAQGRFADQAPALTASAVMGAISESLIGSLRSPETSRTATALPDDAVIDGIRTFCFRALGTTRH